MMMVDFELEIPRGDGDGSLRMGGDGLWRWIFAGGGP